MHGRGDCDPRLEAVELLYCRRRGRLGKSMRAIDVLVFPDLPLLCIGRHPRRSFIVGSILNLVNQADAVLAGGHVDLAKVISHLRRSPLRGHVRRGLGSSDGDKEGCLNERQRNRSRRELIVSIYARVAQR